MKPVQSPLECISYFVTDLSVKANKDYQFNKEPDLNWGDIDTDSNLRIPKEKDEPWQVTLRVVQNLPKEKNLPYNYSCEVVGLFELNGKIPEEKRERMVLVHGSSMLYSVAREVLRSAMSKGPYMPIMLPTVSFFTPDDAKELTGQKSRKSSVTQSKGRT